MSSQFIKRKKDEAAFIITLDNPPVNALNLPMLQEMVEAVHEGIEDQEVMGIIITGAGNNAFSVGADLKVVGTLKPENAKEFVTTGHKIFSQIEKVPKPVIAAVNGLALGGGNELAMSCDIRFASDRARFGQPEVMRGIVPAWGGTQRMTRLLGKAKSKELIFSGQIINAQEALRIGLVNRILPDGDELRASTDYIRMLSSKVSPLAVSQAKIAIESGCQKSSLEDALKYEVEAVQVLAQSEDLKEGIQAFLEKRQPKFSGK